MVTTVLGYTVAPNRAASDIDRVLAAIGGPAYAAGMAARQANPDSAYIPAPGSVMGTRDYYLFRAGAAPASYTNGTGPDYLLDYGLPNFDKFTALAAGDVSPQLKAFISNTALALQSNLEDALRLNNSLAGNRDAFYDAAYATHALAYQQGGFGKLDFPDQVRVALTPSFSDTVGSGSWWKTAPQDLKLLSPLTWHY